MTTTDVRFIHIRHATSILMINNNNYLIDPMLSEKESLPPILLTSTKLNNPRVVLPYSIDNIVSKTDFLLLTHLHFDHFDKKAIETIPKITSILCSKSDSDKIRKFGFSSIHSIESSYNFNGIKISRYSAIHGNGLLKYLMGKGSSYLIEYNEFKIFLTGDCILTNSLRNNLISTKPDIVIANAGAAKFKYGKPITMSITEIKEISKIVENAKVIVIHLGALNHCSETRNYCKDQIRDYSNIYIPNDGENILLNPNVA